MAGSAIRQTRLIVLVRRIDLRCHLLGLLCRRCRVSLNSRISANFSRRLAWNATLVIGGIFGVVAGAAPTFEVLCLFIAFIGFGVGGNLPVDGTMFIEFIPGKHQYLLTLLSVWWAIGQVAGSLIAVSRATTVFV